MALRTDYCVDCDRFRNEALAADQSESDDEREAAASDYPRRPATKQDANGDRLCHPCFERRAYLRSVEEQQRTPPRPPPPSWIEACARGTLAAIVFALPVFGLAMIHPHPNDFVRAASRSAGGVFWCVTVVSYAIQQRRWQRHRKSEQTRHARRSSRSRH
jgi:hypothetical protein